MRVARIAIEAHAASFRYPHFLIARQISFDMPPPATIYGHIASAAGELLPPSAFRFGYIFEFQSKGSDLEHQHVISPGGSRQTFSHEGVKLPVSVEAVVQPHLRDFLFKPKLTLYLDPPELAEAFREPAFCVVLGRSQDLANIVSIETLELEPAPGAYLENTLLPFSFRPCTAMGVTVSMPRYIEPPPARLAHFERYICLRERVFAGTVERSDELGIRRLIQREPTSWWVDPASPSFHGVKRAVVFHCCAPQ
jgi:CRISPR-associated protein Cas5t